MMQSLKVVPVPTQKPRISFIADDELLPKLKAWADSEYRTVSNLVETIVKDAVVKKEGEKRKILEAVKVLRQSVDEVMPENLDLHLEDMREAIAALERGLTD